jgi:hypothetical protein
MHFKGPHIYQSIDVYLFSASLEKEGAMGGP